MSAYFASRNWRNDSRRDGSWPWAKLQAEWAEQPRYFWADKRPTYSRGLSRILGGIQ